jgi:ribosome biogenesis GTPase
LSLHRARVACRHRGLFTVTGVGDEPQLVRLSGPQTGRTEVLAANVDVVFVVTSPNRDLNARRLERFVALAVGGGCETVALLNKSDLVEDPGPALGAVRAAVGGDVPVAVCSALTGDGLDVVRSWLAPGRTIALLGTSGVGKSTLANALLGADVQATAPIRAVDDRGRHTTVRRELFELPGGALLIDTPGLKLPRMGADAAPAFDELDALAESCRFRDCTHDAEPGCAVQSAIAAGALDPTRLEALRALQREQRWAVERESAAGLAERRGRSRAIHREHRNTPPRWQQ